MKKISLFLSLLVFTPLLYSQTIETNITAEKQRLLILPSSVDDDPRSVENEAVSIIADIATRLGRFEIIDRNNLKDILEEQALQLTGIVDDAQAVEMGKIAAAEEALIVKVLNFYQQGVPPKEEDEDDDEDDENGDGLFEQIVVTVVKEILESALESKEKEKEESDPYPHNIQTTLSVQVKKINIETGKSLDSFTITSSHTGGNLGFSRAHVMENFRRQAMTKLKHLYTLTSEVVSVKGHEVLLFLGTEIGVKRGTLFEIVRPDRIKTIRDKRVVIPGRRVGIVEVKDSSIDANRSIILRNWRPIKPGDRALEYTRIGLGFSVVSFYTPDNPYSGIKLGFMARPFHQGFGGLQLNLANTIDSRDRQDFVLGFEGYGGWRFLRTSWFSFAGKLNLNFDLTFRTDDAGQTVTAGTFAASPEIDLELLLSQNRDLVIGVGFRLGGQSSHWTYTKQNNDGEPEQIDATWDGDAPGVNFSGLFITVGLKFISF